MKKSIFIICLALLLVTTIAVQGKNNDLKTITIWHSFTQENRAAFIKEMADKYTATHPNVRFKIEIFPWATFNTKWKTGLSAKELPDLSTALPEHVVMMGKTNALSPLNDMIAEMGHPFIQKPIDILTIKGKTLAVPFYVHARVLWYRKDILQKYDIKPPVTLDDLLAAAIKIKKSGEMYGMAVPMGKNDFMGTIYLYITAKSMGANMITQKGKANLTDPKMIKAIKYLAEMYKNAAPEGAINYGDSENSNVFVQGKTAFFYESGFTISRVDTGNPALSESYAALRPPVDTVGGTPGWFADYVNFVVWKGKNQKIAKDFLKTLYNRENYVKFLHLVPGGMIPSIKGVAESQEFLNDDTIRKHKADVAVITEGIAKGCPIGADYGLVPAMNVIKGQGIIEEMLQKIVMGSMSAEDAAKDAEVKINAEIERINKL